MITLGEDKGRGIKVFIEGFDTEAVEAARKKLAGIEKGIETAVGNSLRRAATSGKSYASKSLRDKYILKSADFKKYTSSYTHYKFGGGTAEVSLDFKGYHIPLIRFDTSVGKDGRIHTRVKRESVKTVLDNAFAARTKNGHYNIFERETSASLPIRQFWGPATPQMLSVNTEVQKDMESHMYEVFDKRLDHEVTRILNGWGR